MMKVTFLGTGGWQGIPAPFGDDEISKKVTFDSNDFRFRTSLLIETIRGKKILIEATPDIRLQSWKYQFGKPDAIFISHWHWDHLWGLLDLDWQAEKSKLSVYGNSVTQKWYDENMSHISVDFTQFKSFEQIQIDNVLITPIPVHHVVDTNGFIFENTETGDKFVYLADFFDIQESTIEMISDAKNITIDATYLDSDINDDLTHMQKDKFESLFNKFQDSELILTNIGSYQGFRHSDFEEKFSEQTIAFDGMTYLL